MVQEQNHTYSEGGQGPKAYHQFPPYYNWIYFKSNFWGIIDRRIKSITKFNPRQKGFTTEPGCFVNVQILHEAINMMKQHGGGVGVVLDVSKAFDTVPHKAIKWALARKDIPSHLIELIMSSYIDVTTLIQHPIKDIPIRIKRGVKQGDPLSPTLFNFILESLLERLIERNSFMIHENDASVLAFADDIVLLARDDIEAQEQLNMVVEYLGALGMSLSIPKCSASRSFMPTRHGLLKTPNWKDWGRNFHHK